MYTETKKIKRPCFKHGRWWGLTLKVIFKPPNTHPHSHTQMDSYTHQRGKVYFMINKITILIKYTDYGSSNAVVLRHFRLVLRTAQYLFDCNCPYYTISYQIRLIHQDLVFQVDACEWSPSLFFKLCKFNSYEFSCACKSLTTNQIPPMHLKL